MLLDTISRHATLTDGAQVALQLGAEARVAHAHVEHHAVVALDEADAELTRREARVGRQAHVLARLNRLDVLRVRRVRPYA